MATTAAKETTITLRVPAALLARLDRLRERHLMIEARDEFDSILLRTLRCGLNVEERVADHWCATYGEPAPEAREQPAAPVPLVAGSVIDFAQAREALRLLWEPGL